MYRKEIVNAMKAVEREHAVAAHAIQMLQTRLEMGEALPVALGLPDVRRCAEQLERTYYIRLFAVFEEALREIWKRAWNKSTYPKTIDLINGSASRKRVKSDDLEKAQSVRDYRNMLVHGGQAMRSLWATPAPGSALFFAGCRRNGERRP
jgi:hypothetical protein